MALSVRLNEADDSQLFHLNIRIDSVPEMLHSSFEQTMTDVKKPRSLMCFYLTTLTSLTSSQDSSIKILVKHTQKSPEFQIIRIHHINKTGTGTDTA